MDDIESMYIEVEARGRERARVAELIEDAEQRASRIASENLAVLADFVATHRLVAINLAETNLDLQSLHIEKHYDMRTIVCTSFDRSVSLGSYEGKPIAVEHTACFANKTVYVNEEQARRFKEHAVRRSVENPGTYLLDTLLGIHDYTHCVGCSHFAVIAQTPTLRAEVIANYTRQVTTPDSREELGAHVWSYSPDHHFQNGGTAVMERLGILEEAKLACMQNRELHTQLKSEVTRKP